MLIPFASTQTRPGWLLACGIVLHDLLSWRKRLPHSRILGPRAIRSRWPSVAATGVRWGGLFSDAQVPFTERLCVELAMDAQRRGAVVLTHAPVEELVRSGGRVTGLRYRDRADGRLRQVGASVVVNAAGSWVDEVLARGGLAERRIGPTKGSHLVVEAFEGAPDTCVFFENPRDHRPMFVLPWAGRYMVGTTDLPYDGPLDEIVIDDDEVDYLLSAVNSLIPAARLTPQDVVWSYSGVRPLPYVGAVDDPATVSREHQVVVHAGPETGLVTVVGGKLTTHRALGEHVTETVEDVLGRPHLPSPTRHAALPGAPAGAWPQARRRLVDASILARPVATRLVDTYGALSGRIEDL
ncbi:MAG: glycerol-3-phosphate dehydrogenase/oxidase, partial [Actinomycetes bacterium]